MTTAVCPRVRESAAGEVGGRVEGVRGARGAGGQNRTRGGVVQGGRSKAGRSRARTRLTRATTELDVFIAADVNTSTGIASRS